MSAVQQQGGGSGLWAEKQRPTTLARLTLHHALMHQLQALASAQELPHLLFYGPSGAGKRTRALALIRELFGAGVEKVKLETRAVKVNSRVLELNLLSSNFHIECSPAELGTSDRVVVMEVIKEMAAHTNLTSAFSATQCNRNFKILLITEADRLSRAAQAALRRTMERYSGQCRLILLTSSLSRVIAPLQSRCLCLRVAAPSEEEIASLLQQVARREGSGGVELTQVADIASHCDRNLRRALLMLQTAATMATPGLSAAGLQPDWLVFIQRIARDMLQEQSPSRLLAVRDMFYELLINCLPPQLILRQLTLELLAALDDDVKAEVLRWAAEYDARLAAPGAKAIFHLEAFAAKFMALYKNWLFSLFG